MDDIGPRRSPAFYWAGFLSHLVSNFKKRCQFGLFQSPFSQTNRSVSKAQTVESSQIGENVRARKHFVSARRTLRGGGCDADGARCAWDSDCSISAFQLSRKLSRNAETPPTGRAEAPRLACLDSTLFPGTGAVEAHQVLRFVPRYSHSCRGEPSRGLAT